MLETTVVVIGGGATGMGTLRDLAMRGVSAILLEQGGLAHGTSSRFHGLLHSGARYAVNDPVSAKECIEENIILRRIGKGCVEETEGFFVRTPLDSADYVKPWLDGCEKAGIPASEVPVEEALKLEPALAGDILQVFRVPDGCVDGFRLVSHNKMSAKRYGAKVYFYHAAMGINIKNGRVESVTVKNVMTGETFDIGCRFLVNAAGSWAGEVAALAGLKASITPDRGTLIAFNHRFTSRVVNRLHPSGDGDIFVPHGSITILGTTSVPTEQPGDTTPTFAEVSELLNLGKPLFPLTHDYRILRAFAGTRPLYTPGGASGRKATRNFSVVDHTNDGLEGMVSVFGGKLTTYRLMAERVTDDVCRRLGVNASCRTAAEPLIPAPDPAMISNAKKYFPLHAVDLMVDRLGDDLPEVLKKAELAATNKERLAGSHISDFAGNPLLCECELVSTIEVDCVASDPDSHSLADVRLRTRLGMGTCQGAFCSIRTIASLVEHGIFLRFSPTINVFRFLQERWKGFRPVMWGLQAREMEMGRAMYLGLLNLDGAMDEQEN